MKNVVVIGGGHGQSTILEGIKDLPINISAIVTVADDGGSTGRLRELYSIPAMGDIRNVLVSLAQEKSLISDLMSFRFPGEEAQDVSGHVLGNLILTAMTQMSGSFVETIERLSTIMNIKGKVLPSSLEVITLYAKMDDDTIVKGESNIPSFNNHIQKVFYDHDVKASDVAVKAIEEADLIIYGIGSLYTSICPNTIIEGIGEALKNTKAKKVYFANCMTENNETYDYDLDDHLKALLKHNASVDLIVKHSDIIPESIKELYAKENSAEVINNGTSVPVLERELLVFKNNLVRHSPEKIKEVVKELLA